MNTPSIRVYGCVPLPICYDRVSSFKKRHRQLEQISGNAGPESGNFVVYRGQGLSYDDFAELQTITNGGLVSCNTSLSMNTDRQMAINSVKRTIPDGFETAVPFSITIGASTTVSIPFGCINDLSYFENSK